MSRLSRLGIAACLLGFVAVCFLSLTLTTKGPFAGLPGIEERLEGAATASLAGVVDGAVVTVDGRALVVDLPQVVATGFDRSAVQAELLSIDGVRTVTMNGTPLVDAAGPDSTGSPAGADPDEATAEATPESVEPTSEPIEPTPEPVEPTSEPIEPTSEPVEPTPEPVESVEPTPEPVESVEPTPEPVEATQGPSAGDIVGLVDLAGVTFAPDTARLTAADTVILDTAADLLQSIGAATAIEVQAHTTNQGDPDVNLLLSQERAETVVSYLIDRGVVADLTPRGYGASQPIADNSTAQGRSENQRLALVVEGN